MFIHPPYSPDLATSDLYIFLRLEKFMSGQRQRFKNDRQAEMSVTQRFQSQWQTYKTQEYKVGLTMTNISIPGVDILEK